MSKFLKYILFFVICTIACVPVFKAEQEKVYCLIGGEQGITLSGGLFPTYEVASYSTKKKKYYIGDSLNAIENVVFAIEYTIDDYEITPRIVLLACLGGNSCNKDLSLSVSNLALSCTSWFGTTCATKYGTSYEEKAGLIYTSTEELNKAYTIYKESGKCPYTQIKSQTPKRYQIEPNIMTGFGGFIYHQFLDGTYLLTFTEDGNLQAELDDSNINFSKRGNNEPGIIVKSASIPSTKKANDEKKEYEKKAEEDPGSISGIDLPLISTEIGACVDYLGDASREGTTAHLLDSIFDIIKIISLIIAIGLAILDYAGAITKGKDVLKEVNQKNVKRIIVLVLILMIPTIIDIIGALVGVKGILCGIK